MRALALVLGLALASCATSDVAPAVSGAEPAPGHRSLDLADLDSSCAACDDFYRFANGGWLDRNPVPDDRSEWSSYDEVGERTRSELRSILENAVAVAASGERESTTAKLGLFYGRCMDESGAAAQGLEPIKTSLDRIAAVKDRADIQAEVARLHLLTIAVPFFTGPAGDPQNSKKLIAEVWQAGTTYSDIGRYLGADAEARSYRSRLRDHIAVMLELAGYSRPTAQADADRVLSLETALARASMTPVQMRDPQLTNNRMTLAELQALTPNWDWRSYMRSVGIEDASVVQVGQPDYIRAVDRLLVELPPADWSAYLRWHLLNARAQWLSPKLASADFSFSASLSGAKAQRPRWARCMSQADGAMGEALGKAYMERVFTSQARSRGLAMIANLKAAMGERLRGLDWMSKATRKEAIAKLDAMKAYVGGPTKWIDYGPLKLDGGSFVEHLDSASRFKVLLRNKRIGTEVDDERWTTLPQRVSGSYSPAENRVTYPAAKFQPPFFDPLADDAVNYGALGATLGHEIVHGFDDEGRQYDAAGNLRDWWAPQDAVRFKERTDRLASQFDNYRVNGEAVNGRLSLGENVADLGGLTISYYALQKALKGKARGRIDGFTPEQRFFLSWARNWRANSRPAHLARKLKVGPHAPDHLRVLGPFSNMPEFAAAFGCKAGDKMFRPEPERVRIW